MSDSSGLSALVASMNTVCPRNRALAGEHVNSVEYTLLILAQKQCFFFTGPIK